MINSINGILEAAKGGTTGVIAVAAAHDQPVIEAVVAARKDLSNYLNYINTNY